MSLEFYFNKLINQIRNEIDKSKRILLESSDLTYYELRQLLTLLYKNARKDSTKEVLAEILKILTVLEIKDKPVPTIKKMASNSRTIWD